MTISCIEGHKSLLGGGSAGLKLQLWRIVYIVKLPGSGLGLDETQQLLDSLHLSCVQTHILAYGYASIQDSVWFHFYLELLGMLLGGDKVYTSLRWSVACWSYLIKANY